MKRFLVSTSFLLLLASTTVQAQQMPEYKGYPTEVLAGERAHESAVKTQIIYTLQPEMIDTIQADQKQMHIRLTQKTGEKLAEMIASNIGETITIQSPSGQEVVTTKIIAPMRNYYILSKEFEKRTDLQKLYKDLTIQRKLNAN